MDASPAAPVSELASFGAMLWVPSPSRDHLKILIVDSSEHASRTLQGQLIRQRAEREDAIQCVTPGLNALVVAEEFQPELVIIEIGRPRRSGACTAKLLRGRPWADQLVIVSHCQYEICSHEQVGDFDFQFHGRVDVALLLQMLSHLTKRRALCSAIA